MELTFYMGFSQMLAEDGVEKTLRFTKEKGFTSVELFAMAGEDFAGNLKSLDEARKLANQLQEYGLTVTCYSVLAPLLGERAEQVEEELKMHAEMAKILGSPFLHHTIVPWLTYPKNAPTYEQALQAVLPAVILVADYCKQIGICCLYEEQGLYFNGVERFGRFFNELKKHCTNVGVCGDCGNIMFVDESTADFFEVYKAEIRHVHLKDYKYTKGQVGEEGYTTKGGNGLVDMPFGKGSVDFPACIKSLQSVGYTGAYAFEMEHIAYVEESMRYIKPIL